MRRLPGAVVAAVILGAPVCALAQEHEGMPQLNFATPLTVSQVVWMAVIFVAMYLLLAKWALPQVAEVVDRRTAAITADLETARAARTEAEAAAEEVAEATRRAHAQAQARISQAVTEAKQQAAAETERANAALEAQLQAAEARIGEAQAAAMGALRQVAAETAALVFDRLTGTRVDQHRLDAAVDAALAARKA